MRQQKTLLNIKSLRRYVGLSPTVLCLVPDCYLSYKESQSECRVCMVGFQCRDKLKVERRLINEEKLAKV